MLHENKAVVKSVRDGSIAYYNGVKPKDVLLKINGRRIKDIISYRYYASNDIVEIEMQRPDGQGYSFSAVDCSSYQLGMEFDDVIFDSIKRCKNKCIFCFEDQLPKDTRSSLKVKDDDYRLSFLSGNFVTFTNVDELEFKKIRRMRLSPLYVSVHVTDDDIRSFMIGRTYEEPILETLKKLIAWKIQLHIQIVLVPGVNDGEVLEKTLSDLLGLAPSIASVGIVPVGLTKHREGLYEIYPMDQNGAESTLKIVDHFSKTAYTRYSKHIFFAADEIYLKASRDIPTNERYDDYPQLENGIGLCRQFIDNFNEVFEGEFKEAVKVDNIKSENRKLVITGKSAKSIIEQSLNRLKPFCKDEIELIAIENDYFGPLITVTGLITGSDISKALKGRKDLLNSNVKLIIPDVMLKDDRFTFLDDTTVDSLRKDTGLPLEIIGTSAKAFIESLL